MSYINTRELAYRMLRLPKADSAFFYFTLEACDNLCFYSTMPHETGQSYRDIEVQSTIEFRDQLDELITQLSTKIQIEVLESKIVQDKNLTEK